MWIHGSWLSLVTPAVVAGVCLQAAWSQDNPPAARVSVWEGMEGCSPGCASPGLHPAFIRTHSKRSLLILVTEEMQFIAVRFTCQGLAVPGEGGQPHICIPGMSKAQLHPQPRGMQAPRVSRLLQDRGTWSTLPCRAVGYDMVGNREATAKHHSRAQRATASPLRFGPSLQLWR